MKFALALMPLMVVALSGPAQAGMAEAQAAYERSDFVTARAEAQPFADQGNPRAQALLSKLLADGLGGPRNEAEAARLLRLAADGGDAQAQTNYGAYLAEGRGVAKDDALSVIYLRKAADQGLAGAMHNLGYMAAQGRGQPASAQEAMRWYRLAAEKGYAASENALGMLYWSGAVDLPANQREAVQWFTRAAQRGMRAAQYNLGQAYRAGIGVPQNLYDAYVWLSLAAAQAPPGDKVFADRDALAARLPPSELARAQEQTVKFRAVPSGVVASGAMSFGTGFFISEDGAVLTAAHVVNTCREIVVSGPAGKEVPARLFGIDTVNDLAVLRTTMKPPAVASLRADPAARPGDGVVVVGFPMKGVLSSEPIVTSGAVSALAGMHDDQRFLQITAPVQPGNSGGPLLDLSGNVVGVVVAKLNAMKYASTTGDVPQNVNFAVKQSIARSFLEGAKTAFGSKPSLTDLRPADVADLARGFVVAIDCRH